MSDLRPLAPDRFDSETLRSLKINQRSQGRSDKGPKWALQRASGSLEQPTIGEAHERLGAWD